MFCFIALLPMKYTEFGTGDIIKKVFSEDSGLVCFLEEFLSLTERLLSIFSLVHTPQTVHTNSEHSITKQFRVMLFACKTKMS